MKQPALSFSAWPNRSTSQGRRYLLGRVCLGELQDRFWSGTAVWNIDRYRESWRTAARHCLTHRQPVLFYTDVTARAATAYHAVPHGRDILLFEQISKGTRRAIRDPLGARLLMRDRDRLSCWTAPMAALRPLALSP